MCPQLGILKKQNQLFELDSNTSDKYLFHKALRKSFMCLLFYNFFLHSFIKKCDICFLCTKYNSEDHAVWYSFQKNIFFVTKKFPSKGIPKHILKIFEKRAHTWYSMII